MNHAVNVKFTIQCTVYKASVTKTGPTSRTHTHSRQTFNYNLLLTVVYLSLGSSPSSWSTWAGWSTLDSWWSSDKDVWRRLTPSVLLGDAVTIVTASGSVFPLSVCRETKGDGCVLPLRLQKVTFADITWKSGISMEIRHTMTWKFDVFAQNAYRLPNPVPGKIVYAERFEWPNHPKFLTKLTSDGNYCRVCDCIQHRYLSSLVNLIQPFLHICTL